MTFDELRKWCTARLAPGFVKYMDDDLDIQVRRLFPLLVDLAEAALVEMPQGDPKWESEVDRCERAINALRAAMSPPKPCTCETCPVHGTRMNYRDFDVVKEPE
jgi:hypothetical protein